MPTSDNDSDCVFLSPPAKPYFYDTYDSPLSTKKERKRAVPRSAPRLIRTAPAANRFFPHHYINKPQFISFKNHPGSSAKHNGTNDDRCPGSHFEQCFEGTRKIGEGSFGEVFCAKSKEDGRWYAVKRTFDSFRSASDRELKLREVQKHELLPKHPNLIEFSRAWEEKGRLFIQTELCEYSLYDYAEREHNIPEEQLWFYFTDLISAVNHLHEHDLVHLDIKPANIFVTRDRVCKLGDFGLIFDLKRDVPITAQEGDSKYLAPEALSEMLGKPTDIFSLGITLLELATDLDLPSRGEGWRQLREGIIPDKFTSKLSPQLRSLIFWMMDPSPEKRPTTEQLLNDVFVREYMALRKARSGKKLVAMFEDFAMTVMLYVLWTLRFLLFPVTWTLGSVRDRFSIAGGFTRTPVHGDDIGQFDTSAEVNESPTRELFAPERDHQRQPMTMPARVGMRSPRRLANVHPIPRLDFDILESPEKRAAKTRPSRRSITNKADSPSVREVADRGSSADELA